MFVKYVMGALHFVFPAFNLLESTLSKLSLNFVNFVEKVIVTK